MNKPQDGDYIMLEDLTEEVVNKLRECHNQDSNLGRWRSRNTVIGYDSRFGWHWCEYRGKNQRTPEYFLGEQKDNSMNKLTKDIFKSGYKVTKASGEVGIVFLQEGLPDIIKYVGNGYDTLDTQLKHIIKVEKPSQRHSVSLLFDNLSEEEGDWETVWTEFSPRYGQIFREKDSDDYYILTRVCNTAILVSLYGSFWASPVTIHSTLDHEVFEQCLGTTGKNSLEFAYESFDDMLEDLTHA